jgi:hypothetical protein
MVWEHSEKTHSNWREEISKALKEGHLTTEITFDGTRYMVTLQPLKPSKEVFKKNRPHQRSRCAICGTYVQWIVSTQVWRHTARGSFDHEPELGPNPRISFPGQGIYD